MSWRSRERALDVCLAAGENAARIRSKIMAAWVSSFLRVLAMCGLALLPCELGPA